MKSHLSTDSPIFSRIDNCIIQVNLRNVVLKQLLG
jgi:hypothetical protein